MYREDVLVAVGFVCRHVRDDQVMRAEEVEFSEQLCEVPVKGRAPLLLVLSAHCFSLVIVCSSQFGFPRVAFERRPPTQSVEYPQQRRCVGVREFGYIGKLI